MPSVDEIFIVSDVAVGTGVDVAFGVAVMTEGIDVSEVSDVGGTSASVAADWDDVAALWQAARRMMERRSGMIFFIEYLFVGQACSLTFFENMGIGGLQTRPT
jgi:excinuclease UvrABC helicase subunit UvrB